MPSKYHITKDTQICCSFSCKPGNVGCRIHNAGFQFYGLDFIYKSFAVADIYSAINAMKCLNIRGAGITMPYKKEVGLYLDDLDDTAKKTGVVNTIVNTNNTLVGYNTDYYAVTTFFRNIDKDRSIFILGDGGMGTTAKLAVEDIGMVPQVITRTNWSDILDIREDIIINCTPVIVNVHKTNYYVDVKTQTDEGLQLAFLQASEQFRLYTGKKLPFGGVEEIDQYWKELT
ncbi:hypothetical protein LCGC14_1292620 [marine sediment metagenome]|uniref:Shikimate dehydrogenase substrate binding N-terminal domain-containing protein n=1 Tax=marine sediment metagenome TaxID=412755 RepID=A0A0F9LCU2_9ZZZZ